MRKRRKVLVILGLIALAVVCFVTLLPRDEPKYQGRYLGEWMEDFGSPLPDVAKHASAKQAIERIGTNGLPYFIHWMCYQPSPWQNRLRRNLPGWILGNSTVANWLGVRTFQRGEQAAHGIWILGTNASSAVPELEVMMRIRTNSVIVGRATYGLTAIGPRAIPVLEAALADPKQLRRPQIVWGLRWIAYDGHTNACLPIIVKALEDKDVNVRYTATNVLKASSTTELLTMPAF